MKKEIIQAIKDFDIDKLDRLLDDDKPYMEVSKQDFLKRMKQSFDDARDQGAHHFDDTFFGICGTCYKGCEGLTFFCHKRKQYLDLVFEGDDEKVEDITCCGDLHNFNDLDKRIDLGFSFYDDEELTFKPSEDYKSNTRYFHEFLAELNVNNGSINLRDLVKTFEKYEQIDGFMKGTEFARTFLYKLYSNISRFRQIAQPYITIDKRSEHAVNALIDYQNAKTEREKVIWYFENRSDYMRVFDLFNTDGLPTKSKTHDIDGKVLIVDWSEYEYVIDYFDKVDSFHHQMCDKYQPVEADDDDFESYGIENYFRLSNVYLDLLDHYGQEDD